ncbi:hypothetical protein [Sphingopyxis sp. MWB1]|uniref:hypothetical protein n=1 Tax=Sphingopyxis sp. MWB1 TaxID=1537715 RepID=UPI00051A353F|nr:hypothetical protein [Sphingopyxis sp. MWB1]
MVDRAPLSRLLIVERDGRLMVVDRITGATPPTAAERMAEHDRRMGVDAIRPELPAPNSKADIIPATPPRLVGLPGKKTLEPLAPVKARAGGDAAAAKPWAHVASTAPSTHMRPANPSMASSTYGSKTLVTNKWWDAKGPRTITLTRGVQAELTSGVVAVILAMIVAAAVALWVSPALFFAAAFLLLRFGGHVVGPLGAAIIDKAEAKGKDRRR